VAVSGLIWRSTGPLDLGLGKAIGVAFIIALLFSGANALMGANRVYWAKARPADALDLALASGAVIGILLAINFFLLPASLLPTGMVLMSGALMFMGSFVMRYRERIITGVAARWLGLRGGVRRVGERVLIVGAGELGEFALWLTRKGDLARAFSVVGLVDDDPHKVGMRIEGGKVLGTTQSIPELVTRHDIGLLLFAISNIHPQERERILDLCGQTSARLVMIPNIMQVMRAHFRIGSLKVAGTDGRQALPDIPGMVQAQKVHAWMEELESLLRSGDYQEGLVKIAQIKAALDDDG
jgi:FlaA1/EpsC-like NDP-sugar epimerase